MDSVRSEALRCSRILLSEQLMEAQDRIAHAGYPRGVG